jgi:hypothetical protein
MSAKNNTARWSTEVMVMAILGLLIWQFAPGRFFYPGLAVAVVLALIASYLIFRPRAARVLPSAAVTNNTEDMAGSTQNDELAFDPNLGSQDYLNAQERFSGYRESRPRPPAAEVAAHYLQMAAAVKAAEEASTWKPGSTQVAVQESLEPNMVKVAPDTQIEDARQAISIVEFPITEAPMPLIVDESILKDEDKNQLENAAWYRCENPYCKYTHFLEVHHIVDEKDGGNNKLENLIVLCPYCHELVHKGEVPEKEMRDWIGNRDDRFRAKLVWPY